MTKLCNTCEYLKFCARSGIEEVGCDRYQKDTTTNEEWIKSASAEQLAEAITDFIKRMANAEEVELNINKVAWIRWLKQPHKE